MEESDQKEFLRAVGKYTMDVINEPGLLPILFAPPHAYISSKTRDNPPLEYVTKYLNVLHNMDYKIVGTHAVSSGRAPHFLWTLLKS